MTNTDSNLITVLFTLTAEDIAAPIPSQFYKEGMVRA